MSDEPFAPPTPEQALPDRSADALSDGWRTVMLITWLLVFGSLVAVAVSSRTIGRAVWWLGPSVDPAPFVAVLVPVALCTVPFVSTMRRSPRAGTTGVIAGVLLSLTALPDVADRPGSAVIVLVIGAAAVLSSGAVALATRN